MTRKQTNEGIFKLMDKWMTGFTKRPHIPLHEYLNMTWEQYFLWVRTNKPPRGYVVPVRKR